MILEVVYGLLSDVSEGSTKKVLSNWISSKFCVLNDVRSLKWRCLVPLLIMNGKISTSAKTWGGLTYAF